MGHLKLILPLTNAMFNSYVSHYQRVMSLDNIISLENPLKNWFSARDSSNKPRTNDWINNGNHPQLAALFRLVKYYNLPIYIWFIYVYIHMYIYICISIYMYMYIYININSKLFLLVFDRWSNTDPFFCRDTSSCHPIGPLHTKRLSRNLAYPIWGPLTCSTA